MAGIVPAAWAVSLLAGCFAPSDPGVTRPEAVEPTPFEQRDLELSWPFEVRLRYIDEGAREADAMPAVLIPGHTSRIEEYDGLVPALAEERRVLVLDFPGSGYSDKPARDYTLRYYEDVLVAFLDELGVAGAHLVGGSQGGNLALRLAYRFPERFPRLAVWAPGSVWEARPRLARALRRLGSVAGRAAFWPIVWVQSRFWYGEDWPGREAALAETFAYYREVMGEGFLRMYFGMAADQLEHSLFAFAPILAQPVWLGWGDQDDGANMGEGVAKLHRLLPRSELVVFPGARHSLAAEIPGELGAAVVEFLDRPEDELP